MSYFFSVAITFPKNIKNRREEVAANATSIYQAVTDNIVKAIEQGAEKFEMPWHRGLEIGLPINANTNERYNGGNIVQLWASGMLQGFSNNHWATFKQWQEIGAQVNKGVKGTPIIFYKRTQYEKKLDKPNELGQTEVMEQGFVLKHSYVFNAAQVSGWVAPDRKELPDLTERLAAVDDFVKKTKAFILNEGEQAFYHKVKDTITMPPRNLFVGTKTSSPTETYYSTLLHELTHWTGAPSRCDRDSLKSIKKSDYAMEELIAELGAAFLCVELQITLEPRPDHAAYIDGWLKIMKEDAKAIFEAAKKATHAVNYLHTIVTGNPYLQNIQEPETVVSEPQAEEPKNNLFVQTIQQKEPPRLQERKRKEGSKVERFLAIKSQKQGNLF